MGPLGATIKTMNIYYDGKKIGDINGAVEIKTDPEIDFEPIPNDFTFNGSFKIIDIDPALYTYLYWSHFSSVFEVMLFTDLRTWC